VPRGKPANARTVESSLESLYHCDLLRVEAGTSTCIGTFLSSFQARTCRAHSQPFGPGRDDIVRRLTAGVGQRCPAETSRRPHQDGCRSRQAAVVPQLPLRCFLDFPASRILHFSGRRIARLGVVMLAIESWLRRPRRFPAPPSCSRSGRGRQRSPASLMGVHPCNIHPVGSSPFCP